MRVVHVIEGTEPFAGTTRTLIGLTAALVAQGAEATCVARAFHPRASAALATAGVRQVEISLNARGLQRLRGELVGCDLVHTHGLWTPLTSLSLAIAESSKKSTVVRPAGSLDPAAMAIHRFRKLSYWRAIDRPLLRHADAIHATSKAEIQDVLDAGVVTHSFIVPNPLEPPSFVGDAERQALGQSISLRPRYLLYLGRLDPKKNIEATVEASKKAIEDGLVDELVIAGPVESKYAKHLEDTFSSPSIRFVGEVQGAAKSMLLGGARMLVLASHGENFGNVVLEALACGTPVVVSDRMPWQLVEDRGVGVVAETSAVGVHNAIERCLALGTDSGAGARARSLADQFSADTVAASLMAEYEQVLRA